MADVTVLGYVLPTTVILAFVALFVGLAMAVMFYLTLGLSVYRSVVNTRRDRVRPALRDGLLDRLFSDDPDWEGWVATLSSTQRTTLESLLDDHLRELDGSDADRLRGLGDALGIPARAGRTLERTGRRKEHDRLTALTWLALLRRPEPYLESSFEPETPRERAITVTLLQSTDRMDDTEAAVGMLFDGVGQQFTVFGQDTLYRVARDDPTPLFDAARIEHERWPDSLYTQVLAVCTHLESSVRDEDLTWLTAALETETEAVRAAAADALGGFGWQPSLRDDVFLQRAIDDPSPRVRVAVYRMLAAWGDESALTTLLSALTTEEHSRALTLGTAALVDRRDRLQTDPAATLGPAWAWGYEHAEYDRIARIPTAERVRT